MATKLLTIEGAADQLGVTVPTLRFWVHKRTAPPHAKIGKRLMWREADIEQWITAKFTAQASA